MIVKRATGSGLGYIYSEFTTAVYLANERECPRVELENSNTATCLFRLMPAFSGFVAFCHLEFCQARVKISKIGVTELLARCGNGLRYSLAINV